MKPVIICTLFKETLTHLVIITLYNTYDVPSHCFNRVFLTHIMRMTELITKLGS